MIIHSTGTHGMLLLSSLPLFLIGLYSAIKKKGIWLFITAVFFTTPLLYGFVGSVHRASRLMAFIPAYVAITTLGVTKIMELKNKVFGRLILFGIAILFVINYGDFINYYWYTYPKFAGNNFRTENSIEKAYSYLSKMAQKNNLTAYVESGVRDADGETGNFIEATYFVKPLKFWKAEQTLPPNSILMSKLTRQPNLVNAGPAIYEYNFFINEGENIIGL